MLYEFSLAQADDAQAVFALYRGMIGTPGCTWSDDYPTYDLVERDISTGSLYILRDEGGAIAAAAAAGPDDELEEFDWDMRNPCELARVAVDITRQNQGIASHLLTCMLPDLKARGFDGIRMLVSVNHPHALALYDKNGFNRLNVVRLYGFDFYRYQMAF